jgi:hypothetical protein
MHANGLAVIAGLLVGILMLLLFWEPIMIGWEVDKIDRRLEKIQFLLESIDRQLHD